MANKNAYTSIIEKIFLSHYSVNKDYVEFERSDLEKVAIELNIDVPRNLGDIIYSFRFRTDFPEKIIEKAPEGKMWVIRLAGRGKYKFALVPDKPIEPNPNMISIKIPDATPGIVAKYLLNDEQALLAKVRYNRLIDVFLAITCYSLQNHLRTTVPEMGQVETDEIYVGLDKKGKHYVVPIQAKGGTDKISIVQIEQDFGLCKHKFPLLICRPVAAQFTSEDEIVLYEFGEGDEELGILTEKHYKLVSPDEISDADLKDYKKR